MPKYIQVSGLSVAQELYDFIEYDALDGLTVSAAQFWDGLSELAHELGPKIAIFWCNVQIFRAKLTNGTSRAAVRLMTLRPIKTF